MTSHEQDNTRSKKTSSGSELAERKGKSYASRKYGLSLSNVKRWCKRYDGTWQSLKERSHRPHSHPKQHTAEEEVLIRTNLSKSFFRYGWKGTPGRPDTAEAIVVSSMPLKGWNYVVESRDRSSRENGGGGIQS